MKTEHKVGLGILGGAAIGYLIGKSSSTVTAPAGALLREGGQQSQQSRSPMNISEALPHNLNVIEFLSLADLVSQTRTGSDDAEYERLPRPANVNELLSRKPTKAQALQIAIDFNIQIDRRLFENPPFRHVEGYTQLLSESGWNVWAPGTSYPSYTTISNLVNILRVAKFIEFDSDVPLLGNQNLYDFLRVNGLSMKIVFDYHQTLGYWAYASERCIYFSQLNFQGKNERELFHPTASTPEKSVNGLDYSGPGYDLTLLAHEAWHMIARRGLGIPHNATSDCQRCIVDNTIYPICPSGYQTHDYALSDNGADAAGYWTATWLADHTGSQLDDQQKLAFRQFAARIMNGFCEQPAAFKSPIKQDMKLPAKKFK